MDQKRDKKIGSGRRGNPVSIHPLTMDRAVEAIFKIKPEDARKIVASSPGGRRKRKNKSKGE